MRCLFIFYIVRKLIIWCIVPVMMWSCSDFIEEDISEREMVLLAPGDGLILEFNDIGFLWEPMDGAREYHLQIVSPGFDAIQSIAMDTLVTGTSFEQVLSSGNYEWRIRGENAGYESPYSTRSFTVSDSSSLSSQSIILTSPEDGHVTAEDDITFSWEALDDAERYIFEIVDYDTYTTFVDSTSITLTFDLFDELLTWRVTGINQTDNTVSIQSTRTFTIDRTAPDKVTLTSPEDETVFVTGQTISLEWQESTDDDFKEYLLYVTDENNDLLDGYPLTLTDTEQEISNSDDQLGTGVYHWQVVAVDNVGNSSDLDTSAQRSFTIQ